jgi:transcriptional regulator with XRE-family HTH domain
MNTTKDESPSPRSYFPFAQRRAATQNIRKTCGLSQRDLADAARVSQTKISFFEAGIQDLGEAAFERVQAALLTAMLAHRAELAKAQNAVTTLAALRGPLKLPRSPEAHYFHIDRRTQDGGYVVEYQGPGMVVCEEYRFEGVGELMEWVDTCIHLGETIWSSNLEPPDDDD